MNRSYVRFPELAATPSAEREEQHIPADAPLQDQVIAVLRGIYDPEIPVNIYDLGLIYKLEIHGRDVAIEMTLTSPNCPVADAMPAQVQNAVQALEGVDQARVRLSWDPPWTPDQLSDEIKLTLGLL